MRAVKSQIIQTKVCFHALPVSRLAMPETGNTLVSRLAQFVVPEDVSVSCLFCGAGCKKCAQRRRSRTYGACDIP